MTMEDKIMLSQFTFSNYRSYRNETTFDFEASCAEELSQTLIVDAMDSKRFLPVSVVYGPNGGGKTNLLRAFICMVSMVVRPILLVNKAIANIDSMYNEGCAPFAFTNGESKKPTSFEVYFRSKGADFRYALSTQDGIVVFESLHRRIIGGKRPAKIFLRENANIELGSALSSHKVSTSVNERMPFLSFVAATYSVAEINEAVDWFESCILQSYASPIAELVVRVIDSPQEKEQMLNILRGIDGCVVDYQPIYDSDKSIKGLSIVRQVNNKRYSLSLDDESDGTRKMFQLLPLFINSLLGGKLLVIDEMDAKLHPTLLRYLIGLYNDPAINTKGAQLWFTSHDLTTMSNKVFRRDEIWFAYRDCDESSRIYSLYDIKTSKNAKVDAGAAYDKQYLEGRYGAAPYFQCMSDWGRI